MNVRVTRLARSRYVLLALGVCLAVGLVWGLASAKAASPSPSPGAKVILRLGWTREPDNLNPFVGYSASD